MTPTSCPCSPSCPYPFSLPLHSLTFPTSLSYSLSLFPSLLPFLFHVPFPFPCIPYFPFPISHPIHWSRPFFPFLAFPYFPFFPFLFPIPSKSLSPFLAFPSLPYFPFLFPIPSRPLFPFLAFPYFPFFPFLFPIPSKSLSPFLAFPSLPYFPFLFPIPSKSLSPFLAFPYFPFFPFLFPIWSSPLFPFLAKKLHSLLFPTSLFYSPFHPDLFSLSLQKSCIHFCSLLRFSIPHSIQTPFPFPCIPLPSLLPFPIPSLPGRVKTTQRLKKKDKKKEEDKNLLIFSSLPLESNRWMSRHLLFKKTMKDMKWFICHLLPDRVPALCSKGQSHADTPSCILGREVISVPLKKCPWVCSMHEKSQYPIYCKLFCTAPPPPPQKKKKKKKEKEKTTKIAPQQNTFFFFFFNHLCVSIFCKRFFNWRSFIIVKFVCFNTFSFNLVMLGGGGGGGGGGDVKMLVWMACETDHTVISSPVCLGVTYRSTFGVACVLFAVALWYFDTAWLFPLYCHWCKHLRLIIMFCRRSCG